MAWQKDGGNDFPAARERRMHVMPTDDAFFIINAKTSDQGVYTCTAENDVGVVKVNATLIVHEAPSFSKPMENKEVTVGSASVLECLASGSPKPQLRWTKDGAAIDATERHFFAAEDQLLIIVGTQLGDSGMYECEMKNDLGMAVGGARLTVVAGSGIKTLTATTINDIVGIVVITVVLCAVVTSIVWVVIIYKAKKASTMHNFVPADGATPQMLYKTPEHQHDAHSASTATLPDEDAPGMAPPDNLVVNIHVNQLHRMLEDPESA